MKDKVVSNVLDVEIVAEAFARHEFRVVHLGVELVHRDALVTLVGGHQQVEFEREGDTYNSMLLQTLTDRLAEATAEYLHEKVRKEYWGYAKDESLSIPDLYKVKYQGIRPAIGYPSLPDQLLNFTLDGLLDMSQIGVSLTENGAMYPTASVSGIYIAHPSSQYFMIGSIDEEQLKDYASRRNLTEEQVRKLLSRNIG